MHGSGNETTGPDISLAGFAPDASGDSGAGPSEIESSDDMDEREVAYAPPSVYRTSNSSPRNTDVFDSEDDDVSFDYSGHTTSISSDGMDEDSFYTDVGDEPALLRSPGQSVDIPIDLTCSNDAEEPIDLTNSNGDDSDSKPLNQSDEPLFSDTRDDTVDPPQEGVEVQQIPQMAESHSESEWEWGQTREDAYISLGFPDVCIFTSFAMDYGQLPLTPDAAQRAANHFYLEEEIARHQRLLLQSDSTSVSTVGSFDPVKVQVMTALQHDYIWRVEAAVNSGLDEDAAGVFTYITSYDDAPMDGDDESNDDDDDMDSNNGHSDDDNADENQDANVEYPPLEDAGLVSTQATMEDVKMDPFMWVLDTGATTSTCKSDEGMVKQRKRVSTEVITSTAERIPIIKRFDLKGTLMSKNNKKIATMILKGVNHAPASAFNLFSVAQSLKNGLKLTGDFDCLQLTKGSKSLRFDIRVRSGSGYLWCARIVPSSSPTGPLEVTTMSTSPTVPSNNKKKSKDAFSTAPVLSYKDILAKNSSSTVAQDSTNMCQKCDGLTSEYIHVLFGHVYLRKALQMAKYYGLPMCTKGPWCKKVLACEACAVGKARKVGVNISGTSTHVQGKTPNAFIYLDISTIRDAGGIAVRNGVWVALVDEFSGLATTMFVATKAAMVD